LLQRQHRNVGRADSRTARRQTVALEVLLKDRDGASKRGDHAESSGHQRRQMIGGFTDADHRRVGQRSGCVEAGVVEAGDDVGIDAGLPGGKDFGEEARQTQRSVEEALDRGGAVS